MENNQNIRYYNAKIVVPASQNSEGKGSGAGEYEVISGELWTKGDKISYCGPIKNPSDEKINFQNEFDLKGNLIIPGLKNAHAHSAMTFLRSFADDLPLDEWLNRQVFPMEAKLTGEDIYWLTRLAILEYLTSGITSAFDMYFEPEDVARAGVDSGFRMVMCGAVNDFKESCELLADYYEKYNSYNPLISYQLGAHAEYTTGKGLLSELAKLSQKFKAPFYIHNSETRSEVESCIERNGSSPTVYLDSLGLFQYGGGSFHGVYVSDEDLKIMKDRKMGVVTNPASNLKLASGIAPVTRYTGLGIPVGIGTDGPASNNALDMFREMYLTTALQKVSLSDAAAMPAGLVLSMAWEQGAHIMQLKDCDSLRAGKQADFAVIDLNQPNMQPENNLIKNIVYSGSKQNIAMTVIGGIIRYSHGTFHVGESPEYIYKKANEIITRMQSL